MGIGSASGENRAIEAAKAAINSPLLDISIDGARGVLFTIAGGSDMTMFEIQDASKLITESIDSEAKVIFGAIYDDKLKKNEIKITVIATGFPEAAKKKTGGIFSGFESKPANKVEINVPVPAPAPTPTPEPVKEREVDRNMDRPLFSRVTPAPTPSVTTKPIEEPTEEVEDEDWSSIPAFLRRSKGK
jgi:cell division protein FtsZ